MPKERSKRSTFHNASVKLTSVKRDLPEEETIIGRPVDETQAEESVAELVPTLKKKDKQQIKREAFLQRMELTQSPYSKSHQRRLKRKTREQIGQGLDEIRDALQSVDKAFSPQAAPSEKPGAKVNGIGEGQRVTLSDTQRKKALKVERLRHPLILSNPKFSSNPFETIRQHAENTLLKHEVPS
ncbi:hypothetical protein GYMLUDRAFT_319187 [Collybiopsis luxurians FD-317 M1]|nr:hypothetical protein GYMLUDRAFT_319187 [Collybiopsis luxurians FD-317 M1]